MGTNIEKDWINKIHQGHVIDVLRSMPDNLVDMVITSPPYWALRDYSTTPLVWDGDPDCDHEWDKIDVLPRSTPGDRPSKKSKVARYRSVKENRPGKPSDFCKKCGAWRGQLGLEPTFDLYIQHLCNIFEETRRVLKPEGTLWVNLGDTYNSHFAGSMNIGGFQGDQVRKNKEYRKTIIIGKKWRKLQGLPDKCLCCVPDRFAIEMIKRGWILRNTIIWWKPNCIPSSVKDRFTVDFENIFLFAKNKKYYFEQQYEEWTDDRKSDRLRAVFGHKKYDGKWEPGIGSMPEAKIAGDPYLGRNKRSVWELSTTPFSGAHFAVFPEKLLKTPVKAGCPRYICEKCGEPRRKVINTKYIEAGKENASLKYKGGKKDDLVARPYDVRKLAKRKAMGYTKCNCGAGFRPGVVLDPFMGSGTTAVVAKKLGRWYVGIELNDKYILMARRRIFKAHEETVRIRTL